MCTTVRASGSGSSGGSFGKASVDLNLADLTLGNRETVEPWAVCFHAQQAAEKGIEWQLLAWARLRFGDGKGAPQ